MLLDVFRELDHGFSKVSEAVFFVVYVGFDQVSV
jgi:hypothetical protein